MVPELPETLVHGREAAYFRYFLDIGTTPEYVVTDEEIEHYVTAYGDIARLHAAFEMYRAIPENAVFNDAHRAPVNVPLLLVGGEQVFGPGMPHLAKQLRAEYGWTDVDAAIVAGARHYLPEERPGEIAELIETHARRRLVMNDALPEIVSEQEWQKAFDAMLVKEKDLTRARDEVAAARRRMPMVRVEKDYRFVGPDGEVGLLDLFAGRRQLVVYRFFFEPGVGDWPHSGCPGCSFFTDHVPNLAHVNARDTTFVLASPADQDKIAALKGRMDWHAPWYTMVGDDFGADFGVSEWFGINVFLRDDDGRVYRTYFVTARGAEPFTPTWAILDVTPFGRQEEWEDSPAGRPQSPPYEWWRLHDEYGSG
jgi:predicted dithiol-disulfide oxidoreductase (DUF899 family)